MSYAMTVSSRKKPVPAVVIFESKKEATKWAVDHPKVRILSAGQIIKKEKIK